MLLDMVKRCVVLDKRIMGNSRDRRGMGFVVVFSVYYLELPN
jgi:hypothetical protein